MVKRLSTRRLDAASWIAAALDALAAGGPDIVRVERLAVALGVTKGSFYWHFRDREELLCRALHEWAQARIAAIAEQAARPGTPAAILEQLLDIYARAPNPKGLAVELAIRGLARAHDAAAQAVAAVDTARLKHVGGLFRRLGLTRREAEARALLFYAFLFGQSLMGGKRRTAAILRAAKTVLSVG